MQFFEQQISSQPIYQGNIFKVKKDTVLLQDGAHAQREICEHNAGVAVLAVDSKWRCALVRQYRYAMQKELLELPAGKLENEEKNPLHAALRELSEETGIVPNHMIKLGEIYPSPGFLTECIHLYLAFDLQIGQNHLDDGEYLEVVWLSMQELKQKVAAGQVRDAKTISALALAEFKNWQSIVSDLQSE